MTEISVRGAGGRSVIRPNVRSTSSGFPFELCGVAAVYPERDRVLDPRNDVQLLLHWSGAYRARQGCLCANLKRLYLLVGHCNTEVAHIKTAVWRQSAQRYYIVNRVGTSVLDGKLLCKRAGWIG